MIFYRLWLLTVNSTPIRRTRRKINHILGRKGDITSAELVRKYVAGKSFADIGCLWGVNGLNSFVAEDSGASKVISLDVYPANKEFLEEHARRKSFIQFIQGDINLHSTSDKIGECDVVLCAGVLYHTPDPFHLLTRLRAITKEKLILNTASIPEVPWMRNTAVFYPYLNKWQRKVWNRGTGSQKAITGPYEPAEGYGNWFWGMTPSCVESMLYCAGFKVIERHVSMFNTAFVCETIPIQYVAESGEWNTPRDPENARFKR